MTNAPSHSCGIECSTKQLHLHYSYNNYIEVLRNHMHERVGKRSLHRKVTSCPIGPSGCPPSIEFFIGNLVVKVLVCRKDRPMQIKCKIQVAAYRDCECVTVPVLDSPLLTQRKKGRSNLVPVHFDSSITDEGRKFLDIELSIAVSVV
jgi:hypothetical protein